MSDTPLGAIFFGFIIAVGVSLWIPMLLQIFGLPWAPFAAWICARSARKKGLDVRRHAVAGALYSALMFWPWVYFILRMNGRDVPAVLIRLFYIYVFAAWILGAVFWMLILAIASHPGTDTLYEFSNPWVILSYMEYALVLANVIAWFVSLRMLRNRRRRAAGSENRSDAMICREYLTPPAFAIVSVAITAFCAFWLYPIWASIFGERL